MLFQNLFQSYPVFTLNPPLKRFKFSTGFIVPRLLSYGICRVDLLSVCIITEHGPEPLWASNNFFQYIPRLATLECRDLKPPGDQRMVDKVHSFSIFTKTFTYSI